MAHVCKYTLDGTDLNLTNEQLKQKLDDMLGSPGFEGYCPASKTTIYILWDSEVSCDNWITTQTSQNIVSTDHFELDGQDEVSLEDFYTMTGGDIPIWLLSRWGEMYPE